MNIHEAGIYESARETDKQKQMEGKSHRRYFVNTQSKSKYHANIKSQNQPNTATPYCYLAKYGDRHLVIFFSPLFNYQLQQAARKRNGNLVKSGKNKYMQIHWHVFPPHNVRNKVFKHCVSLV